MFIGGIQAFIFALLTVLYFGDGRGRHTSDDARRATHEPTHEHDRPPPAA